MLAYATIISVPVKAELDWKHYLVPICTTLLVFIRLLQTELSMVQIHSYSRRMVVSFAKSPTCRYNETFETHNATCCSFFVVIFYTLLTLVKVRHYQVNKMPVIL